MSPPHVFHFHWPLLLLNDLCDEDTFWYEGTLSHHSGMKAHSVTTDAIKSSVSLHTHNLPGCLKSRQKWPDVARSFLYYGNIIFVL